MRGVVNEEERMVVPVRVGGVMGTDRCGCY